MVKKTAPTAATEQTSTPLRATRDQNFARLAADGGLATYFGHDVMLTLFALEPAFVVSKPAGRKSQGAAFGAKDVEIACVRMSPGAAQIVAQNILTTLLQFELADADELKSHIDQIAAKISALESGSADHGN